MLDGADFYVNNHLIVSVLVVSSIGDSQSHSLTWVGVTDIIYPFPSKARLPFLFRFCVLILVLVLVLILVFEPHSPSSSRG
mmetsp:Transcript_17433/g.21295  ORF Transcript_17433/g.21295 Transcript_17433/m.21295 type:complete len:81 (+) Transcript_17433:224-466(+)